MSSPVVHADIALICELDEQWSFIGSKARQHCYGSRIDETCRERLTLLTFFNIGILTADECDNYARELPKEKT